MRAIHLRFFWMACKSSGVRDEYEGGVLTTCKFWNTKIYSG